MDNSAKLLLLTEIAKSVDRLLGQIRAARESVEQVAAAKMPAIEPALEKIRQELEFVQPCVKRLMDAVRSEMNVDEEPWVHGP